ncbi:MAG: translocation/assembly module TamB domain-containing protein, partial [Candidatus Krumholzibacteriota bacterium]|nr:translocation/assembly module TamB domain-containing protein [Candidatus Krumholzibacteriota bacterium]
WVRNQDLSVEMRGELILKRDEQGLYLRGDLTMLRGSYNVYANKFRVIDGTLNFSTAETLRPEVYINAYTPYRNEGGIEKRIFLSLNWPQDKKEPTIQLSYEDPGYYESDLWRMLGGSNLAGGIAANTLERALNQQMSGLSIEVDQERNDTSQPGTPEQEMMIGVGKYLWEDFYLRYRQGLTFSTEQQIQMEYRISRLFLLRSEFIRNSRRGYIARNGQYTDEFNFDVKFRWEY